MDRERFDALVRLCATSSSRRGALAALLGAGLSGALWHAEGKGKNRKARNRGQKQAAAKGTAAVAVEASCASPGPSANLNGCNFNDAEFAGIDLSSSSMKGTKFRRADLCGADLSSSNLRNAEFQNANLTKADLSSSACKGAKFNGATFCQTKMCNGSIRNDACPGVDPDDDVCCSDEDCPGCAACGRNKQCEPCPCCDADGECQPGDLPTACGAGGETCENCPAPVGGEAVCNDDGNCAKTCPADNPTLCGNDPGTCLACCTPRMGCATDPGCRCLPTNAGPDDCYDFNTCNCVADCANCPSATHVCGLVGAIRQCPTSHPCCQRCRAT